MNKELPTIAQYSNVSNTYTMGELTGGLSVSSSDYKYRPSYTGKSASDYLRQAGLWDKKDPYGTKDLGTIVKEHMSAGRVVQVFICDPDKNVPLDKRLLYKGDVTFTDASDQDLFFDIDIKAILKTHNELRATLVDKAKSSSTEKVYLEPVRVSGLKMVVSELAKF